MYPSANLLIFGGLLSLAPILKNSLRVGAVGLILLSLVGVGVGGGDICRYLFFFFRLLFLSLLKGDHFLLPLT